MCEEKMNVVAPPRPRYHVGANKSIYFGASFDTIEEAVTEASRLALEGYDLVTIRDNDADEWAI